MHSYLQLNENDEFVESFDGVQTTESNFEGFLIRQLFSPLRFARTLIQLGYEPLPPKESYHPLFLFGYRKPCFLYPSTFAYSYYLIKKWGFWSVITSGFQARFFYDVIIETCQFMTKRLLIERAVNLSLMDKPARPLIGNNVYTDDSDSELSARSKSDELIENILEESSFVRFIGYLSGLLCLKSYEVVITQPFYVIMVRQMASFVGGESGYSWFHQAVGSIYRDSGLLGFFQGIAPRLICETARLFLYYVACRFVRRYALSCEWSRFLAPLRSFLFLVITCCTYRFEVVTCMMSIRGARLQAAEGVNQFSDWRECKRVLVNSGQSSRGAMPIWRSHVQPQHIAALKQA